MNAYLKHHPFKSREESMPLCNKFSYMKILYLKLIIFSLGYKQHMLENYSFKVT